MLKLQPLPLPLSLSVKHLQGSLSPGTRRCYELLNQTSRSFAAVIQALDDGLRWETTLTAH